jgi:hypothetical protein
MRKASIKSRGRESLHSLTRELPNQDEFKDIESDLTESSDRSAAIIASSMVELCLEKSITEALPRGNKVLNELIGRDGALNSFYSKNYLGYALSLYGDEILKELEAIRRIRNAFAHAARPIKFSMPMIGNECAKLRPRKSDRKEWPNTLSAQRITFTANCVSLAKFFLAQTVIGKIRKIGEKLSSEQVNAILKQWQDEPFYSNLVSLFGPTVRRDVQKLE